MTIMSWVEFGGASSGMYTGFKAEPGGQAGRLARRFFILRSRVGGVVVWFWLLIVESSKHPRAKPTARWSRD